VFHELVLPGEIVCVGGHGGGIRREKLISQGLTPSVIVTAIGSATVLSDCTRYGNRLN
jgi:hypothetical protein